MSIVQRIIAEQYKQISEERAQLMVKVEGARRRGDAYRKMQSDIKDLTTAQLFIEIKKCQ